jgi:hypothetical protein
VTYVNCGDWVDSCTAIVEHHDGRLELIHAWQPAVLPDEIPQIAVSPAPALCVPAGTLDQLPQPGIAVGGGAIRL